MPTFKHAFTGTIAASALLASAPVSAAELLFEYDSGDGAEITFVIDQEPTPFDFGVYSFDIQNVSIIGDLAGDFTIVFFTDFGLGGFSIPDVQEFVSDQLFSGSTSDPTFLTGTFCSSFSVDCNGPSLTISEVSVNAAVPEPATWAMLLLGMFGIAAAMRRRPAIRAAKLSYS